MDSILRPQLLRRGKSRDFDHWQKRVFKGDIRGLKSAPIGEGKFYFSSLKFFMKDRQQRCGWATDTFNKDGQPIYEHYMYVFLWLTIRLDNIRIPSLFSFFTNSLPNSRVHLTSPLPTTVPHLFPWWHLNIHTQYPTIIHTFKGHFSQKMGLGPFFSSVIINFKTW